MIANACVDSSIMDFLDHIDESSDSEIFYTIKQRYGDIIFEIYENRHRYNQLLLNSRFISILYQVIYTINVDDFLKMCCDSLLYYIVTTLHPNDYIKGLVFMLGELINKEEIDQLKSLKHIDYELLTFLAISNHSINDDIERVSRVNFTLCTSTKSVLTIADLRYIYAVFYSKEFSALLMGTVFDTTIDRGIEKEEPWVTPIVEGNNNQIKNTILLILENLDTSAIVHYLKMIGEEFSRRNFNEYAIGLSFRQLNAVNFNKINIIGQQLQAEGITVP
jgi:hypothetical protein